MNPDHLNFTEEASNTFMGTLYKTYKFIGIIPMFISWIGKHKDVTVIPLVETTLKLVREKANTIGNNKLGVIGFCWGGRYTILSANGPNSIIDAYAVAHPSQVSVPKDINEISKPGLFLFAETDFAISHSEVSKIKEILTKKTEFPTEFVHFPGTEHGFTVRGGPSTYESRSKAAEKVVEFLLEKLQ